MKHADHDHREQRERRRARGRRPLQNNAGSDRRWIEGKDVHLAEEIRYIQQRAAERDTRIVTIGPLLLFSAESGDAWMLDPADRLATRLAEAGDPRLARVEETEELCGRLAGPLRDHKVGFRLQRQRVRPRHNDSGVPDPTDHPANRRGVRLLRTVAAGR